MCEELMELADVCEACDRYNSDETRSPYGYPRYSASLLRGVCVRGHVMRWAGTRWRCVECDVMYADRKRAKRKAGA